MNAAIQKLLQAQIDLITEHALLRTTLERYLERMPSLRECVEPVDDLLRVE